MFLKVFSSRNVFLPEMEIIEFVRGEQSYMGVETRRADDASVLAIVLKMRL